MLSIAPFFFFFFFSEEEEGRGELNRGGACRNGSDARGYFVWSFLDVFEFLFAYELRFGLCGVDMAAAARTRYPRSSARWYAGFLRGGELRPPPPALPARRPYAAA